MNRRRFLRGLGGVIVGLPMLESLLPRSLARAQAAAPRRLITFFQCNGANMNLIWPNGAYGALTAGHFTGRSIEPLANYRDKLLFVRNLHMTPKGFGQDPNTNGCDHQKGTAQKLTAAPLNSSGFATGVSIDQFVATQVNAGAKAAMTLGVHYVGSGPTGSISYSGSGRPVTSESNPRLAFQDLMGITATQPVQRDLLGERRKSVLDLVHADFDALKVKKLSKADQTKLDQHFSTIRDLELALMPGAGMPMVSGCQPLDAARASEIAGADQGVQITSDAQFKRVGRMQMDMIALALACDRNRVATLQWGSGAGGPIFKWDGMDHQYNHHKLSHGNTKDDDSGSPVAGYEGMIAAIDKWFAGEFVYLLDRLKAYGEGDGKSLLDNSCVLWINELSDGKGHDFRDLPVIIAGSCGGAFKQGQYINMSRHANALKVNFAELDAPHNKLLTTIANVMGAKAAGGGRVTHFGDTRYGAAGDYTQLLV